MDPNFENLKDIAQKLKSKLDSGSNKKKIVLLYAFNGTGKTRLSSLIPDADDESDYIKALRYNAFFEDMFTWNNDEYILEFKNPQNYIVKFIVDQGLENQITDNFQTLTRSKILPDYDLKAGKISFTFASGDERAQKNIKISRGEESLFVWSVFYTVIDAAISALNEEAENRETEIFNNLKYIIIDDPVSSIDDTKIITMAIELTKVINSCKNNVLRFFVTSHHALFFNVLFNEYSRNKDFKFSQGFCQKVLPNIN